MEINITALRNTTEPMELSASAAEIGQDAGRITWSNALQAPHLIQDDETTLEEVQDYLQDFGAWSREDLEAMTHQELNALVCQFIAGDWREAFGDSWLTPSKEAWTKYEADATAGRISGNFFRDESQPEIIFYQLSH